MKLSKNNQIIIVIMIIVVAVIGFTVFSKKNNTVSLGTEDHTSTNSSANVNPSTLNEEKGANQLQSIDVPAPVITYTSKDDGFAVKFPTTPKVTSTTYKSSSSGLIPLTEYTQDYTSGLERAWYKVAVYHFPAQYKFANNFLDESADVYVGSVSAMHPGSKVTSHQKIQFLGNPAITGTITVPVRLGLRNTKTVDTNNYAMMTVKGQNLYIISTYGTTEDIFNSFINSFKFQ